MKNSKRRFVFLVILVVSTSMLRAQNYRVVGYYPMSARTTLPTSSVQYSSLTHMNHAFAWPNPDGTISSSETNVDTALINATHRAGRRILLSFGGAGATQAANISLVVGDSLLLTTFINNVVARLATYHYDGFDLDWEGPATRADKANEVTFVQRLRAAFQAVDSTWLITMAIGMSNWSDQWHDFTALIPYVDWFNAMEYDFHGSWSQLSGHNAPLYAGTDPAGDPDYYSIDQSLQYLTVTRGIPAAKLTLGLPFYGKSFGTSSLYAPYTGEQELAYRDIVNAVQTSNWTYVWDSASQVPFYRSTTPPMVITFDDSASLALKCQYAKSKGLSGVMIWEVTQDVIGQHQPLMDVVGKQMMRTTGIVEERSESLSEGLTLFDNYPNPFNPTTAISFQLTAVGTVTLKLIDLLGREVVTLVDGVRSPGVYTVRWDGSSYPSGVYFYRLQAHGLLATKKMLLIK